MSRAVYSVLHIPDRKFHIPFQSVYGSASFIRSACAAIHYQKKLGASSFYSEN